MQEFDITKIPFTSISRENWEMLLELDEKSLYDVIQSVGNYVITGERCDCEKTLNKIVCNQLINVIDRKAKKTYNSTKNLPSKDKIEPTEEELKEKKAKNLYNNYKRDDTNDYLGETTTTPDWIYKNILSGQHCIYCDESDWRKLGCDRIDNNLPHTPDNVVCACGDCNVQRGGNYTVEEFKRKKSNNGQLTEQERWLNAIKDEKGSPYELFHKYWNRYFNTIEEARNYVNDFLAKHKKFISL